VENLCVTIRRSAVLGILLACPLIVHAQIVLEADGPGATYELINSVLAPGGTAVEHPDASHPAFGRHIAEVWDSVLNQYVFEFSIHVTPDDDRGINTDRQRVEIKTYDSSPDNLKGVVGETITYRWKFKITAGFKPSSSFTHIHQIKPVGGDDGNPLFTLTPRKGSPNKMELIHNNTTKVAIVNLSLFEGEWVECTEIVYVHPADGRYAITVRKIRDGGTLLSYNSTSIMTVRADNDFIRPKWGIYRSLNTPSDLRDETVRFAGFSIQEGTAEVDHSALSVPGTMGLEHNFPNPFNSQTTLTYRIDRTQLVTVSICDVLGRDIATLVNEVKLPGTYPATWYAGGACSGAYLCRMRAGGFADVRKLTLIR